MISKPVNFELISQSTNGYTFANYYTKMRDPILSEEEYRHIESLANVAKAAEEFLNCLLSKSEFILGYFLSHLRRDNNQLIKQIETSVGIGVARKLERIQNEVTAARSLKSLKGIGLLSERSVSASLYASISH